MRVTGIITCRNYADFVGGAIESFALQEYEPKNLVVVDDGSSDGSWDAILEATDRLRHRCAANCFRIDTPQGVSFAKNLAIEQSINGSDAFAFLDADDLYLPGKVAKSVASLSDPYGHPGVAYSDYKVIDEIKREPCEHFVAGYSLDMLRDGHVAEGNFVVLREVVEKIGRFDGGFKVAENFDFLIRVSRKFMLLHIPEALVVVRSTNRSLSRTVPASDWAHYRHIATHKHNAKKT
jgi:glycosyltransferase involved in cell wall biosynthesis